MSALRVVENEIRQFFTIKELARLLNVGERTVYSLLASGAIASYKVAGSRRIDPRDVERYLQTHREGNSEG